MNWNNIFQSIVDTWLPLLGFVGVIAILAIIVYFIKKKKK